MDPIATLRELLQAIKDGDRRQAAAFAGSLHEYWRFTGMMPSPEDLQTLCGEFTEPRWVDRPRRIVP